MIVNDYPNRRTYHTETGGELTSLPDHPSERRAWFKFVEHGTEYMFSAQWEYQRLSPDHHNVYYSDCTLAPTDGSGFDSKVDFLKTRDRVDEFLRVYKWGFGADEHDPSYIGKVKLTCEIDHSQDRHFYLKVDKNDNPKGVTRVDL